MELAKDLTNSHVIKQFFSNSSENYEIICRNDTVNIVYSDIVYRQIVDILSGNPFIDKIFILRSDNTFSIWTSLKKYDRETRYSLYRQELEVIKYFSPVEFHFDFHVADAQDAKELLTSAKQVFPK